MYVLLIRDQRPLGESKQIWSRDGGFLAGKGDMNPFPDNNGEALQQRAIALIKPLIPPDAQAGVIRADKEFRKIVRSYKAHAEWLKDSPTQRGESVRFAMLRARGRGQVTKDVWLNMLAETKNTLTTIS